MDQFITYAFTFMG